jgi:hypothetical protein
MSRRPLPCSTPASILSHIEQNVGSVVNSGSLIGEINGSVTCILGLFRQRLDVLDRRIEASVRFAKRDLAWGVVCEQYPGSLAVYRRLTDRILWCSRVGTSM